MNELSKKERRMKRMLEAVGAYIEPNGRYPDPFNDLEDEIFEEYIKSVRKERETKRRLFDSMHKNMALIARAIPSMNQKAAEFKADFSYLEKQIDKMYKGE